MDAGLIYRSKSRQSRVMVGLYRAKEADLDDEGGPFVTVCETHGHIVNHANRKAAESAMPYPADWCEPCRANLPE